MSNSTTFTSAQYDEILSLAGAQRGLFDEVNAQGLSDSQSALHAELMGIVARAKAFDAVRSQYLDFAYSTYSANYHLIQGAIEGQIGVVGLNYGNSIELKASDAEGGFSTQELDDPELVETQDALDDLAVEDIPLRGSVPNPMGLDFVRIEALAKDVRSEVSKVSKAQAVEFFMQKALDLDSPLVPDGLASLKVRREVLALQSYSDLSALIGDRAPTAKLEALRSQLNDTELSGLSRYAQQVGDLVGQMNARVNQLSGWMVKTSGDELGHVKTQGLDFFLGQTLEGNALPMFVGEANSWFMAKSKQLGYSVPSSAPNTEDLSDTAERLGPVSAFLFDGQMRDASEAVWSESELREYKALLDSGVKAQFEEYRDRLQAEKEALIEFHGEEAIKEHSLDIGTLAIESLEAKGVFPPENVKRKVFAEVPDDVKAMSRLLLEIQERKAQAETIDPWDDFEGEEALALFNKAVATMQWATRNARVQVAYSGGKDSSILLYAVLRALKLNQAQGVENFPVRVISGETLIENPEITNNLYLDHQAIAKWAKGNNLEIECKIATPTLLSQYQVAQVGGRKLHNMPSKSSECSSDWKISPMNDLRNQWRREVQGEPIITVTGTRTEESIHRGNAMRKREDSDEKITVSDRNELIMSPIASMTSNNVFHLLDVHLAGEIAELKQQGVAQKDWPYPTDGTRTQRIYSDSASSSCEIVNTQVAATKSTGCGARTGCWNCVRVKNDSSAENMLKKSPESYAYMAALLRYRKWVSDVHDDPANRSFIGRSITPDGLVRFGHDNYHPKMLHDMLRYLLTMQVEHEEIIAIQREADPTREYPSLMVFNAEQLFAVQYEWSRYGREANHPFEALRIYNEVMNEGKRYYPPVLGPMDTAHIAPLPAAPSNGFISVGKPFVDYNPENMAYLDDEASGLVGFSHANQGLRNVLLEAASFDSGSVHKDVRDPVTGSVSTMLDGLEEANRFEIDHEAAEHFLRHELPFHLEQAEKNPPPICAGHAAKVLLEYGVVRPRNIRAQHELISQYQYLESRKLTPATYDHAACLKMLVDADRQPLTDKRAFTIEHYYLDADKANKKISENRDLLNLGRSKNELGQSNAVFMPKDEFNKYKRLEVQMANNRVLMEVNNALSTHFEAKRQAACERSGGAGAKVLNALQNIQALQQIASQTRNNGQTEQHLAARQAKERETQALVDTVTQIAQNTSENKSGDLSAAQVMQSIVQSCAKGAEIENDLAGIEVQRRMMAQQAQQAEKPVVEKTITFHAIRV